MALKSHLIRWLALTAVLAIFSNCLSTGPAADVALPATPADKLEAARQALKADRPVQALSLLLNLQSPEETAPLLAETLAALEQRRQAAVGKNERQRLNLEETLALAGHPVKNPGLSSPASVAAPAKTVPSAEQLLAGTVTVMVNKGLKMEKGVAAPEIVIGSGFFITDDGYLLTNHHVIASEVDPKYEGYSHLTLKLFGSKGEKVPAKVIGWDENFDIALLKAEVKPKYVFQFAADPSLKQGESIRALGSPGGLDSTVTSGIISATKRRFLPMGDAIQVDVAINPGNSGGPLVNAGGEVLGICFAGIAEFQGVNFAIPGNYIQALLPKLRLGGAVVHHWLGLGLTETLAGLEVTYASGPSRELGLMPGDVLKALNGKTFASISEIQAWLLDRSADSLLKVEWERAGTAASGWTAPVSRPRDPLVKAAQEEVPLHLLLPLFGVEAEQMGDPFWSNYLVKRIISGSPADDWGLTPNDPFTIQEWRIDEENKALIMRFFIKKKTGGYLESSMQVGAYLVGNDFV